MSWIRNNGILTSSNGSMNVPKFTTTTNHAPLLNPTNSCYFSCVCSLLVCLLYFASIISLYFSLCSVFFSRSCFYLLINFPLNLDAEEKPKESTLAFTCGSRFLFLIQFFYKFESPQLLIWFWPICWNSAPESPTSSELQPFPFENTSCSQENSYTKAFTNII